jgi:hypothetical protein
MAWLLLVVLTLALVSSPAWAAETGPLLPDHPLTASMASADRIAFESIAAQPESLHPAILLVASHEHVLVQLPAVWRDFELELAPQIEGFDEDERRALQHLLTHPGLLDALVEGGPHDEAELLQRLEAFPEEVREVALVAGLEHYGAMNDLHGQIDRAVARFERLIRPEPAEVQAAYREVVGHPQLTSLLLDQIEATQQIGGAMRAEPKRTPERFASLGRDVRRARKQAEEEAERRRIAEERARREAAALEAQRRAERRARRLYWGRYPYWGSSACWDGDPFIHHYGYGGHRHCWYPWHRYRRVWW